MNIEFSTIDSHNAEKYFKDKRFAWLNEAQKNYVLKNLGDIRVQDPMMYPEPRLAIHNDGAKHYDAIMDLTIVT